MLTSFTVKLMAKLLILTLAGLQTSLPFYLSLALCSWASSDARGKGETYLTNAAHKAFVFHKALRGISTQQQQQHS